MVAILVVLTILALASVDAGIQWAKRRRLVAAGGTTPSPAVRRILGIEDGLALPPGFFFHRGHTWAELHATGSVRVGFDDFVQRTLGRPDRTILLQAGERVAQGEAMLALEQNGRRILLPAPMSGVIEAVNQTLGEAQESPGNDPYQRGWIYQLKPSRLGYEIQGLRVAETAKAWLGNEVRRFVDWASDIMSAPMKHAHAGVSLQDGGMPVVGVLAHLDDSAWNDFQVEFLGNPIETDGKLDGTNKG
jgi:glycine cleavage system H lipoate-binding protein